MHAHIILQCVCTILCNIYTKQPILHNASYYMRFAMYTTIYPHIHDIHVRIRYVAGIIHILIQITHNIIQYALCNTQLNTHATSNTTRNDTQHVYDCYTTIWCTHINT